MHCNLLKIQRSLQSRIDLQIHDKIKKLFGVPLTGTLSFCRHINVNVLKNIIRIVFVTLQSDLLRRRLQIALVRIK